MTADNVQDSPANDTENPLFYIGVGASAGGLEAIEALFSAMPADTGMAFVVIQHLSPDYKSMMVELLSKRTSMPVLRATDGVVVEPNVVYLIPPKVNLTMFKGKILLSEQETGRSLNLPIDIFFRSLAEDQGRRAVGVVLSGTGSDGMRGVRAIKDTGGMVMVQDGESAKFDGMPRAALSTGLADFVLPAEEMADQLVKYAESPHAAKAAHADLSQTATDLDRVFAMLRDHSKVDFTYYKPSTVTRRIERRMTVNQTEDLRAYVRLLEQNPRELTNLYRELLIGVTSFFRDPEAFALLRETVLPEMFEELDSRATCRLWVAGCSTGEEAYSLAILCNECMEQAGRQLDLKIFATDIDQNAIVTASNGVYPASLIADLPKDLQEKYFTAHGADFQVTREIREYIVFAQHNVLADPPFTNINLVSCRNLLIYLEPVLQEKVLELFNFSLTQQGRLFLGNSETPGRLQDVFETLNAKWRIYRSKGRRLPTDPGEHRAVFRVPRPRMPVGGSYPGRGGFDDGMLMDRLLQTLTKDLVPLVLVVNEQQEMLYSAGAHTDLLTVPAGRVLYHVGKMMPRELSIPLTSSVQRAYRTEEEVVFTNIVLKHKGASHRYNLRVKLFTPRKTQDPLALVLLEDAETQSTRETAPESGQVFDMEHGVSQRLSDLEQELQFTKENLQATIEELETSNEELQATNEELLASNEELQSTNEELQSVNEELHTVNAEHQLKILELTEMTNDLDNLLRNTRQGTLFLDENFEIRKFTPEISDILQIRKVDEGRPLIDLNHRLVDCEHPYDVCRGVAESGIAVEREVQNDEGRHFLMRVLPYSIAPNQHAGLVLAFVDLSHVKRVEAALDASEIGLRDAAQLAQVGSWTFDPQTGQHMWSDEVSRIHDLPPGEILSPEEGIQCYTPASREIITRVFTAACEWGEPYDEVLEIKTPKGRRKWVRTIGNPIVEDGVVVRITGAFQDVSRLHGLEQEVEDLKQKNDE